MKTFERYLDLIIVVAIFLVPHASANEVDLKILDTTRIKAFFVYPLTTRRNTDASWIEISKCAVESANCDDVILRLRVGDLKLNGTLSSKISELGKLAISINELGASSPILIAESEIKDHWFPRMELCKSPTTQPYCHYIIEADSKTKSLSIRLIPSKEVVK